MYILSLPDEQKNQVLERAKNMVLQKYEWELIAKQMEEVFARVFQNR